MIARLRAWAPCPRRHRWITAFAGRARRGLGFCGGFLDSGFRRKDGKGWFPPGREGRDKKRPRGKPAGPGDPLPLARGSRVWRRTRSSLGSDHSDGPLGVGGNARAFVQLYRPRGPDGDLGPGVSEGDVRLGGGIPLADRYLSSRALVSAACAGTAGGLDRTLRRAPA